MKPIEFENQTDIYAKNQPPYLPLPVYEDNINGGRIIHCWKLSLLERFRILFSGVLWIQVLTFHQPPQPIRPMAINPFKLNIDMPKRRSNDV